MIRVSMRQVDPKLSEGMALPSGQRMDMMVFKIPSCGSNNPDKIADE